MGFNVPSFRCERVFLSWEEVRGTRKGATVSGPGAHHFRHSAPYVGTAVGGLLCQAAKRCCTPSSYLFILALFVLL